MVSIVPLQRRTESSTAAVAGAARSIFSLERRRRGDEGQRGGGMDLSAGTQGELPIPMHAPASPFTGGEGAAGVGGHVLHQLQHHEAEHGNNNSNGNEQSSPAAAAEDGCSGKKRAGGAGSAAAVKYGECLKNHAAAMGGNATDGCGEFMPSGEEGSLEALKCSACGCHRNFHRKEVDDDDVLGYGGHRAGRRLIAPALPHHNNLLVTTAADPYAAYAAMRSVAPLHQHQFVNAVPLSAAAMQQHASESDDGGRGSKKRFRTKFTAEQKERMLEFAERVGWRLQKVDDAMVQAFCHEIGVKRRVLKVWMHNNKYNLAIKRLEAPPMPAATASPPPQMPMPMEPPSQPDPSFHLGGPSSPPPQQMVMPMVPPPPPPSQPEPSFHLGGPSSPPPQQMVMPMVPPPPFHRGPDSPEPLKLD